MEANNFLAHLKQSLDQALWPTVVQSLRHEPLVWESLQGSLGGQALARKSAPGEWTWSDWTPASLALMALGLEVTLDELHSQPMRTLPEADIPRLEKADRELPRGEGQASENGSEKGENDRVNRPALTLARAGLQAMVLRERRRVAGAWDSLKGTMRAVPRPVLACLYGMLPDQDEFIQAVLDARADGRAGQAQKSGNSPVDLALSILLSNPLPTFDRLEKIQMLMGELPAGERFNLLRNIEMSNPELGGETALYLLAHPPALPADESPYPPHICKQLSSLVEKAEILRIAGQAEGSLPYIEESIENARRLQGDLAAQLAIQASDSGLADAARIAWERAIAYDPQDVRHRAGLILSLLDNGQLAEAADHLEQEADGEDHPLLLLAKARLNCSGNQRYGDPGSARTAARLALKRAAGPAGADPEGGLREANRHGIDSRFFLDLTRLMLDLGDSEEAILAARVALAGAPNDPDRIALLSQAQSSRGDFAGALLSAHLASALAPSRIDLRRLLVEATEAAGDYPTALEERARLLQNSDATTDDLRLLAACAIRAGQPQRAVQACEVALKDYTAEGENDQDLDEQAGLTYALLGEALAALGENDSALDNLKLATQLAPHQAGSWLALARVQGLIGQPQRVLETLRYATRAVPDSPEIYLALGEAYLSSDSPTQALNALRYAADLASSFTFSSERQVESGQKGVPSKSDNVLRQPADFLSGAIALRLGQTLHRLGHLTEARQALKESYRMMPSDPERAYSYAKVLLALGELRRAISPLATVIQSQPPNADPYLDYARCLLRLAEEGAQNGAALRSGDSSIHAELLLSDTQEPAPSLPSVPVERALPSIQRALELDPERSEAKALLAEALAACGKTQEALAAYRQALETDLVKEPAWKVRLSLGLGQAAIKLGQYETAVASLVEASQVDPLNHLTQRTLAIAYEALGLHEDAYGAARAAMLLSPADLQTLVWFATMAMNLAKLAGNSLPGAQTEAVNALERSIQLSPERTDLRVWLGQIQMEMGDRLAARNTFKGVLAFGHGDQDEEGSAQELFQAGRGLLDLGDPAAAAQCLERALRTKPNPAAKASADPSPSILEMLTCLAAARYLLGDAAGAMESLDGAISLAPSEVNLYVGKIDLLVEAGKMEEALACLETSLAFGNENPSLVQRAVLLHRATGCLDQALDYARKFSEHAGQDLTSGSSESCKFALGDGAPLLSQAGEIALLTDLERSLLQYENARVSLDRPISSANKDETDPSEDWIDYLSMRAEFALEAGDTGEAATSLAEALELAVDHPRLLAIQARLVARQDMQEETERARNSAELLERAIDGLSVRSTAIGGEKGGCRSLLSNYRLRNTRLSVAEAALELNQWVVAIPLSEELAREAGQEPYLYLNLARAFILRAEFKKLSQDLEVTRHAPGAEALSESSKRTFEDAIQTVQNLLNDSMVENQRANLRAPLRRWAARGQAIFNPSPENAEALAEFNREPEDVAARVCCLGRIGDLGAAGITARAFPQNPLVLAQLALALSKEKPRQALAAAHAATEAILHTGPLSRTGRRPAIITSIRPLVHILLARLMYTSGGRAGDGPISIQAALNALAIWPDEPNWHILVAQIYLSQDTPDDIYDPASAISHLEQAVRLGPVDISPYMMLGQIYLQEGTVISARRAIHFFEGASRLALDDPEVWLALARAHRMAEDLSEAADCAQKAMELGPELVEPLLLRGEIALLAGQPKEAYGRAQAALKLDPNHPEALVLLARSLVVLERPDEALATLEKALPLAEQPLPLLLERARLLQQSRGRETALQALKELAERYPEEPVVLLELAEALEAAGQYPDALHAAQRALRAGFGRFSDKPGANQAQVYYLLGRLLRRAGQLDGAIHHLSEAIQLAPDRVEAYLELGHAHEERRQYVQALKVYQQAISAAPQDPRPYYLAGQMFKENKDYVNAEVMLRRAAELSPNEIGIHRLLAAVVALNLVHNRRQNPIKA